MSIITLLNQVHTGEMVLPAIQRNFVWNEDRIYTLLDSVLRGYPIGIVLLWETYEDIQVRSFERDYRSASQQAFRDNTKKSKLRLVLDGQQRLQSLYVALYGSFEGKLLYFDTLSGRDTDDLAEQKFAFFFGTPEEAKEWNLSAARGHKVNGSEKEHWIRVQDVFTMTAQARMQHCKSLKKELHLSDEDALRLELNLARFDDSLQRDVNILRQSVIDENRPAGSPDRKTESDVLEIFVRINKNGMSLTRSDLIFSMLKLNWKESSETLPDFVRKINEGNAFEIDPDFVIRCLLAVCDLGTRFDIELLRSKSNVEAMKRSFAACCKAIEATVDFVQEHGWCASSKLIGGTTTLVPFVYYFFRLPKHELPNKEIERARKALFLFAFTKPFSRYVDSRLGAFLKNTMKPLLDDKSYTFPFDGAVASVKHWEKIDRYDINLLQGNPFLAAHLVQRRTGAKVQSQSNLPEVDHIFPRSILKEKGFEQDRIDHVANFWILPKHKNQNKSNKHPKIYFKDVPSADLKRAQIDPDLLEYPRYKKFLKTRSATMLTAVSSLVGLSEEDFAQDDE